MTSSCSKNADFRKKTLLTQNVSNLRKKTKFMTSFESGMIIQHGGSWTKKNYAKLITAKSYEDPDYVKTVHGKSTYKWYTDDIRVHTSDIRKTYEYIQVTYGWYKSMYGWHDHDMQVHTGSMHETQVHTSGILMEQGYIRVTYEWIHAST